MLGIIAWRNIWRSTTRSMVVIGAITLGIWALTFAIGFMNSMMEGYIRSAIDYDYSHIQIHKPEYKKDRELKHYLPKGPEILSGIQQMEGVKAASGRLMVTGMASSPQAASGVQIMGVNPEEEVKVVPLVNKMDTGSYFGKDGRNPVLIGYKLANKLNVRLKSKIVLTFQDIDGNITAGAFRVAGIYTTSSVRMDEATAVVRRTDLERLIGAEGQIHEIAIYLNDPEQAGQLVSELRKTYPQPVTESWRELSPELNIMHSQSSLSTLILLVIIMLGLAFGIINTMLMAVLERVKELGMLMALGMNRVLVFFMIMLETILLSAVGVPVGMLLGYATITYFGNRGIDLSGYAEGLQSFGYETSVYPFLELETYLWMAAAVVITAVVGAIYPAVKAVTLKPVEAIRKI